MMEWRCIHVQCADIIRFTVLHNRHHKVSESVPFFVHCKTVTILRIRVRGHFVMSITKNHKSYDVTVLDNPLTSLNAPVRENDVTIVSLVVNSQLFSVVGRIR